VLEIQDGSLLTGSSNISETTKHIIKIPTSNLRHSTMAKSQEVYRSDSNNDRQSAMAAETGNASAYVSETTKSTVPTTNLRFKTLYRWKIVLAIKYSSYRQTEILIWPPKPEMVRSLEL